MATATATPRARVAIDWEAVRWLKPERDECDCPACTDEGKPEPNRTLDECGRCGRRLCEECGPDPLTHYAHCPLYLVSLPEEALAERMNDALMERNKARDAAAAADARYRFATNVIAGIDAARQILRDREEAGAR